MDYPDKHKKNFNFIEKKKCALKSLHEVNCFLTKLTCNIGKACAIKEIIK